MALADNLLRVAEIIILGQQSAGGGSARPCFNVFHFARPDLTLPFTEAAVLTAFDAAVLPALAAATNFRYTMPQCTCRMIDDPTRAPQSLATGRVGLIATDSHPQHNTVSMRLNTIRRKPRLMGAKRFGGVNEVDTTADVLVGDGLTRWQTVRNAVFGGFIDANGNIWVLVVLSRKGSQLQLIPQAVVDFVVCSQVVLRKNISLLDRRRSATVV